MFQPGFYTAEAAAERFDSLQQEPSGLWTTW